MEGAVQGKVMLVTGGGRRVGAAICRRLHAAGASIALHYRSSAEEALALQDELNAEEKLLEVAQQNLKDGEANPEVFKGADGRTYRNVAKFDAKIKQLNDQVDLHQQNVAALKAELSKFKSE